MFLSSCSLAALAVRPEAQAQRRAEEAVGFANLVLQVALLREMNQVRIVDVEQERRRIGPDL